MSNWKSSSGHYITTGLFHETAGGERSHVQYTLKPEAIEIDGRTLPSLRKAYVSTQDPTEIDFANAHLGGWEHWCRLRELGWFQEYYQEWKEELASNLQSIGIRAIISEATSDGKNAFSAAKYLADRGWEPKQSTLGRPTKERIKKEAHHMSLEDRQIDELHNMLKVVN